MSRRMCAGVLLALSGLVLWHPRLHPEAVAQSIINTEAMFATMKDSLLLGVDVTGNLSLGSV